MTVQLPEPAAAVPAGGFSHSADEVDFERRFGGLARLYGRQGAQQIAQARVAVVGIGGVGSWAAEALARSGVAQLVLVDLDNVAESNINRQIHATSLTLGQPKVQAMRERIALIHPSCRVHEVEDFVDEDNVGPILGACSLTAVIDACDQVRAKAAMAHWCGQQRLPFISVGGAGGRKSAHQMEIADLGAVTHDPLLAQLRYRLRKHYGAEKRPHKPLGVPCIFSREAVVRAHQVDVADGGSQACEVQADHSLNCAGYGSSVAVTASFGMAAAGWIMQQLAQKRG